MKRKSFLISIISIFLQIGSGVTFDVLRVENVTFPFCSFPAANLSVPYDKDIAEFTICYRFLVDTYNTGWSFMFYASKFKDPGEYRGANSFISEWLAMDIGFDVAGYDGYTFVLDRNITNGGLSGMRFPTFFHVNLPRNIDTGTWYHYCSSYSSSLGKAHMYGNGLRITDYDYEDENEGPLSKHIFENIVLFQNMRGMFTDLNIYSSFFDEKAMIAWTTGCDNKVGEKIYSWDTSRLNITQTLDSPLNVSFIKMNKDDICPDPEYQEQVQEPSKLASKTVKNIFRPKSKDSDASSYVGKILELMTDPVSKDALECKDRCFRLGGEIMTVPQTEEEKEYMDKIFWEYKMKKAGNDIDILIDKFKIMEAHAGGETNTDDYIDSIQDLNSKLLNRNGLFPKGGYYKYYHPVTKSELKPLLPTLLPLHNTDAFPIKQCLICFSSLKKPFTSGC